MPVNIERTLPPFASDTKPIDGSWQIVNGTRFKFFVYSAFYDRRGGKLIRIIGATKTRVPEKVWCRFVYNMGNVTAPNYRSVSVMARVKVSICPFIVRRSLLDLIYLTFYFKCNYLMRFASSCSHPISFQKIGDTRKLEFKIQCVFCALPSDGSRCHSSICS